MKKEKSRLLTISIIALLLVGGIQLKAQKVELSPLVGYETGAYINYNAGRLHIIGGLDYGGSLNVGLGGGRYAELSYTHMKGSLENESVSNTVRLCDLGVDYYSAGVLQEMKPDAKATPYGLFTLGVVNYRPSNPTDPANHYANENKMHISLAGGVKINASEKVGIRLQARLLMPLYYAGTYFSAGTGGAGYGVSGGIIGVQGDFTAALVIKLR
jgi:hypothetical protein